MNEHDLSKRSAARRTQRPRDVEHPSDPPVAATGPEQRPDAKLLPAPPPWMDRTSWQAILELAELFD